MLYLFRCNNSFFYFILFYLILQNLGERPAGIFSLAYFLLNILIYKCIPDDTIILSKKFDIYCSYFSDNLELHKQLSNGTLLACYGEPLDGEPLDEEVFSVSVLTALTAEDKEKMNKMDNKEDYYLGASLTENTLEKDYTFDYDSSNPDGVLTLDVGNGRVFYA